MRERQATCLLSAPLLARRASQAQNSSHGQARHTSPPADAAPAPRERDVRIPCGAPRSARCCCVCALALAPSAAVPALDSAAESMREVGTRCDRRQNLAAVVPGYRSSLVASAAAQQRTAAESERRRDASQQPQEPESRRGRRSLNHLEERSEELLPAGADPPQHQQLGAALPHPSLSRPRAGFLLERQPEYGCAARTFLIASSLAARCESSPCAAVAAVWARLGLHAHLQPQNKRCRTRRAAGAAPALAPESSCR
jgi:hypothetical protein